jgi:hypothetical protein
MTNLRHILPILGERLLSDIVANDIARYQQKRVGEQASPKTINLEVGTLRAIPRRHRLWANLQPDVRLLAVRDDLGKDEKKPGWLRSKPFSISFAGRAASPAFRICVGALWRGRE